MAVTSGLTEWIIKIPWHHPQRPKNSESEGSDHSPPFLTPLIIPSAFSAVKLIGCSMAWQTKTKNDIIYPWTIYLEGALRLWHTSLTTRRLSSPAVKAFISSLVSTREERSWLDNELMSSTFASILAGGDKVTEEVFLVGQLANLSGVYLDAILFRRLWDCWCRLEAWGYSRYSMPCRNITVDTRELRLHHE